MDFSSINAGIWRIIDNEGYGWLVSDPELINSYVNVPLLDLMAEELGLTRKYYHTLPYLYKEPDESSVFAYEEYEKPAVIEILQKFDQEYPNLKIEQIPPADYCRFVNDFWKKHKFNEYADSLLIGANLRGKLNDTVEI